jgi:WD40 repeat protein
MRHIVSLSLVTLIAALVSYALVSIALLLFMRSLSPSLSPREFEETTRIWIRGLGQPPFLTVQLLVSGGVALATFVVFKKRLPDQSWWSLQTAVILLLLAAILFAVASIAWRCYVMLNPPVAGPQQTGLPALHLIRTLTAGPRFGAWQLAWSADAERLAAYEEAGIITWSPDGSYRKEFPLFKDPVFARVLHFLSGHRLLITSAVADIDDTQARDRLGDMTFSVVDAETGRVVRSVPGPHPGGRATRNAAINLAVSPDEHVVAVICASGQLDIYSTRDWQHLARIDLHAGEASGGLSPGALAFSPDGKTLAFTDGRIDQIKFFEVGSWTLSNSLVTYPDAPSEGHGAVALGALAFSPDGAMIAVASAGGGSRWAYPKGIFGSAVLEPQFPADPLRIYRISDGRLAASLASFPGGLSRSGLAWSPGGEYLAFQDAIGDVRFWKPFQPNLSVTVARGGFPHGDLLFANDRLAANFPDGVKLFEIASSP